MSTSKNIDLICIFITVFSLLLTALLMTVSKLGVSVLISGGTAAVLSALVLLAVKNKR
ncbi:MAG: hypothetical protein II784_03715 [Oscillospiraceae bacterium]|nr:hypothetical protein [Oscillospiraceae bacterium]